jgi:hypothetical protein
MWEGVGQEGQRPGSGRRVAGMSLSGGRVSSAAWQLSTGRSGAALAAAVGGLSSEVA